MKRLLLIVFSALATQIGWAQALRDINYNYLYNPEVPFTLTTSVERTTEKWKVYSEFILKDTTAHVNDFLIQFELRAALHEKEGKAIGSDSVKVLGKPYQKLLVTGVPLQQEIQILVIKVSNNLLKKVWFFYQVLEPKDPRNAVLFQEGSLINHFGNVNRQINLKSNEPLGVVSYYADVFPAATPPFEEAMAKVSAGLTVDSTFTLSSASDSFQFLQQGLYLIQQDTLASVGVAFRLHADYPRYNRIENLADPLIYVCTKQEFDRVKAAKGDKKAFDKVMLSITQNTDRARQFVRSYFRRVELANTYFTSYKEGWKTDRGMIYIIFGLPDEVYKFNNREVWSYKAYGKLHFNFVKSASIFDPDNYVLVRERKFQEKWYEMIDLWRNARF